MCGLILFDKMSLNFSVDGLGLRCLYKLIMLKRSSLRNYDCHIFQLCACVFNLGSSSCIPVRFDIESKSAHFLFLSGFKFFKCGEEVIGNLSWGTFFESVSAIFRKVSL